MNLNTISEKKKTILIAALNQFLLNNTFPEYNKFRLKFEDDWDQLDELVKENYFDPNRLQGYKHYVLRLKALKFVATSESNEILKSANKLIEVFKSFYRADPLDNKFWHIDEIVKKSGLTKDQALTAIFFLDEMFFFGGYRSDQNNEYIRYEVSIREIVLKQTTVEEFLDLKSRKNEINKSKKFKTTLILGAGLGVQYGYPDGPGLKDLITKKLPDGDENLKNILYWTPAETVDEIAARHPNYADLLRQIVIKILAECEDESKLGLIKNDTYKIMLKQIGLAKENGHDVNILTFNYDRSLPLMLERINQIEPEERRISHSIITAIYGRLAPLSFEEKDGYKKSQVFDWKSIPAPPFYTYGRSPCPKDISRIYWLDYCAKEMIENSNLRFIGEAHATASDKIKSILEDSDQIFFLGCGYHQANLDILGFDFNVKRSDKLIAGTGLGLSQVDIESIQLRNKGIDHIVPDCDAFTFLKRKFDISDPSKNSFKKLET